MVCKLPQGCYCYGSSRFDMNGGFDVSKKICSQTGQGKEIFIANCMLLLDSLDLTCLLKQCLASEFFGCLFKILP